MGETQKKSNGIAGLFLLFGWLMFILLALIFYFYYWDDLPFIPGHEGYETGVQSGLLEQDENDGAGYACLVQVNDSDDSVEVRIS